MNDNANELLVGNLKTMYFQTKEWIDEIEFYEVELNFLNSLISDRIDSTTTYDLDHKSFFRKMDAVLFKLSDEVIIDIKNHRKDLCERLEKLDLNTNGRCSREHMRIFERITKVKHGIRKLKSALFRYIKRYPFEFDIDRLLKDMK